MEDKRHPRLKEIPFEVPENIDPDAFLFLGDPEGNTRTLIGRWWTAAAGVFMGGGSVLLNNTMRRRPLYSGSHKLALFSIAGGFLGEWLHQYRESYTAERDLQMFHYICLHPEDFPKPKRVLYRDYLTSWYPIR